jgi:hypothetical protein
VGVLTSVRVPGRVVRRGRSGVERWWALRCARLARERITALFAAACASPPSVALRPRVEARSSMTGASLPAAQAAECVIDKPKPWSRRSARAFGLERERARMAGGLWGLVLAYALQSVAWPPNASRTRCSIRFARLERERKALASHRRAHRHLPSRCARASQRVRRSLRNIHLSFFIAEKGAVALRDACRSCCLT